MSASRREMNPRRVAKSVRTHQATMAAYGRAAQSNFQLLSHSQDHPNIDPSDPHRVLSPRMTNSKQTYHSVTLWRKPKSVSIVGSPDQKVDAQHRKGLITQAEHAQEKTEIGYKTYIDSFHNVDNRPKGKKPEKKAEYRKNLGKKDTLRAHVPTEDF